MVSQEEKEMGSSVSSLSTLCPWNLSLAKCVLSEWHGGQLGCVFYSLFIFGLVPGNTHSWNYPSAALYAVLSTESSGDYFLRSSLVLYFLEL